VGNRRDKTEASTTTSGHPSSGVGSPATRSRQGTSRPGRIEAGPTTSRLDLAVALLAHEIRGPLAEVRAALDRALAADGEPATRRRLLLRSQKELGELAELADGLLRWASGLASLRRRRTDLGRLVAQAVRASGPQGAGRVRLSAPPGVLVLADASKLRAALANVVRNALAHSPPEAEVRVTVTPRRDLALVRVEDRGPGVAPDERDAIFRPFVRGRAATGRQGSGLGLFLARRVVEAHQGSIRVDGDGRGAVFEIELPREAGTPPARGLTARSQAAVRERARRVR
jgi:signal transduction histidine kinase